MATDPTAILLAWLEGTFLRYQLRWALDDARIALALKGRQLGFTDGSAAGCILGGLRDRRPQIVLSAAQANANLLIEAVRTHCRFLAAVGLPAATDFLVDNSEELAWRSGGSVTALAANERTARSFHGDLWLDEFAYHQRAEAIWAAAAPMASRGWRVRVFSTPNGGQGLFYDWCTAPPAGWSFHRVGLDEALADGLRVDRAHLLELVGGDERLFAEAYLRRFLDADQQWIPTTLADAALRWPGELPDLGEARFYAGLDVGRFSDLTVLTVLAVVGRWVYVVATFVLARTRFRAQRKVLEHAREVFRWEAIAVDATGLGSQLAEELQEDWGDEVQRVTFSTEVKAALVSGAVRYLRDGRLRFQRGEYGAALHKEAIALRRRVTKAANVVFESPKTTHVIGGKPLVSHGDFFWSFGLGLAAAGGPVAPCGMGDRPLLVVA